MDLMDQLENPAPPIAQSNVPDEIRLMQALGVSSMPEAISVMQAMGMKPEDIPAFLAAK